MVKQWVISQKMREIVINRDGGNCYYCEKQGTVGYRQKNGKLQLDVWEVVETPPYYFGRSKRNPDGSNSWILPFEVRHKQAMSLHGIHDESNLVLSCRRCSRKQSAREACLLRHRRIKGLGGMTKAQLIEEIKQLESEIERLNSERNTQAAGSAA